MHIAIIGNGITGVSCARFLRKLDANCRISLISAETDHFFSRTALMYIYMGHMTYENTKPYEDWFWEKNRIDLVRAYVERVDTAAKQLVTASGKTITYDKLVLATGSKPNKFGWPGQDLDGVQGLYSYQDLELLTKNTTQHKVKRGVIVGGGLIGIELAEMLLTNGIAVTMLVRESNYWNNVLPEEEATMVSRHIREHHVDLRLATELKEVIDDGSGRCKGVITNTGEKIDCEIVGLTAGVSPNIAFLKNSGIETARGILVDHHLRTNVADVYAAGDCAQFREPLPGRRPIEQVWYTGRRQGATVAHNILKESKPYAPRLWYNSAKFFDIEYQTYGTVMPRLREGEQQFYWEHTDGKCCVKIVYDGATEAVIGFNVFGTRLRHEVCEKWLLDKTPIDEVVANLPMAIFDPEFYPLYEGELIAAYNKARGRKLVLKQKRGLAKALAFLKS